MSAPAGERRAFTYRAQTGDGTPLSGVIEASDTDDARFRLQTMGLRLLELEPAERGRKLSAPLTGSQFVAFNEQLAALTRAGLPLERGLRLIAADLRPGRLSRAADTVAAELEAGATPAEAFEAHRGQFPAEYAELVGAGMRTGRLDQLLSNLSSHMTMVSELRRVGWQVLAYPLMVVLAFLGVLAIIGHQLAPRFREIVADYEAGVPQLTLAVLGLAEAVPLILLSAVALLIAGVVTWLVGRLTGRGPALADRLLLPLPAIGPVLRHAAIARWTDTTRIAIDAGLGLPEAMRLAARAVGLPSLKRDVARLNAALEAARPLEEAGKMKRLPASAVATIELGQQRGDLSETLDGLTRTHQRRARQRTGALPIIASPVALVLMATMIGVTIIALFLPLVKLIQAVGI